MEVAMWKYFDLNDVYLLNFRKVWQFTDPLELFNYFPGISFHFDLRLPK